MSLCSSRKYPYSPQRKDWNFLGGGGGGGSVRLKTLKKCIKLNWNFQRGGGGVSWKKSLPWGRYGYFLELHIPSSDVQIHPLRIFRDLFSWVENFLLVKNSITG